MGTRADFYIGNGEKAKWLGSIGWDGSPSNIPPSIKLATKPKQFEDEVISFIKISQGTLPEMGWPWPWNNSSTTDYSYLFIDNKVYISWFGQNAYPAMLYDNFEEDKENYLDVSFPDMSSLKNVTFDSKRSGLMIVNVPKEELKNQQNILLAEPPGGIVPDPVSNYKNKTDFAECRDLWLNHGCSVDLLYGDDGEMQCNNTKIHRPIDFLRESLDRIKQALPQSKPTRQEYVQRGIQ
jgi:hypothetical protein